MLLDKGVGKVDMDADGHKIYATVDFHIPYFHAIQKKKGK